MQDSLEEARLPEWAAWRGVAGLPLLVLSGTCRRCSLASRRCSGQLFVQGTGCTASASGPSAASSQPAA